MIRSRLGVALVLAASALLFAGCADDGSAPDPTQDASPPASATAEPSASAEPTARPDAEPTCKTLVSASTVADFESLGWTSKSDILRVGSLDIPDGLLCVWGDFTTASGLVQQFGWGPITANEAEDAQTELIEAGWRREEGPQGVYLTENPETALTVDADGYGHTYLFGDGWVTFSDTKLGLLLVERPNR